MSDEYEAFCMADAAFYDAPANASATEPYRLATQPAPSGWRREENNHWVNYAPTGNDIPAQGWKVHVSGCTGNAERIIDAVWTYCVPRDLPFKFLRSPRVLLARNAKYAGRGGSGKLVTIYPRDEAELELACKDLDQALAGEPGPYILSDLRWGAGPVHVRYGGFVPRRCRNARGEEVLAIEDPSGTLVPDERGPVFSLPPWVSLPDFLVPHLEARNAVTLADVPYDIREALHFSNGGGVYAGIDRRTGEKVVLKEARPHAGLSGDGADAVTRLHRERSALERLAGIDAVPRLLDTFSVGEHEFLVMEHVEGEALNKAVARRCPLLDQTIDDAQLAEYAAWARALHDDVSRAIDEIHARGLIYCDLHLFNVIVRPDGRPALIDFEVADEIGSDRRPILGAGGFAAPGLRGADIDRHALACLKLALFLPLIQLIGLDRDKAADLADVIAESFPVERAWLDEAVRTITRGLPAVRPSRPRIEPTARVWPALRASLAAGILASATPERDDRLFPGDIAQFRTGGLNLAHGAAGVLYALDVTGAGRFPAHEDWLLRQARRAIETPGETTRLGLYEGLHGVAYVLDHLGHRAEAVELLEFCLDQPWDQLGHDDLGSGLAGIGLNLAHFARLTGDPALDEAAGRARELVAGRLGGVDDVPTVSGGEHPYAGLLRGAAGRALLFLDAYEHGGDPALLDHAATALRQDLRRCVPVGDQGHLHVDEGWRTMPYLQQGSAGIGLVLARYLAHRQDDDLVEAAEAIGGAARAYFYVLPGLFSGRAGMILYLAATAARRAGEPVDEALGAQIRRLSWHALGYQGHLAFPGDRMLRLSMDLATGSAGVLLALGAALHDDPVHLPFLAPARDHMTLETSGRR